MQAHIHPSPFRFTYGLVSSHGSTLPGSVSRCSLSSKPPSAQSPFARLRRYLFRRDVSLHHVRGRYPSFFAPTGSCARPSSSHLLVFRLVWWVFAGCRQSLLDVGLSRRYLRMSFLGCLAPYPGVSPGAFVRFFPEDSGLPPVLTGSAFPQLIRTATSARQFSSGLQTFPYVQASKFARHPGRSNRYDPRRMAAVAFTSEHRIVRFLPIRRIC